MVFGSDSPKLNLSSVQMLFNDVCILTSSAMILSSSCLLFDSPMAFTKSKKSRPVTAISAVFSYNVRQYLLFNLDVAKTKRRR